jgi:hypothetical protein
MSSLEYTEDLSIKSLFLTFMRYMRLSLIIAVLMGKARSSLVWRMDNRRRFYFVRS